MSEERLRKDINRLKQLTNGCIPEYHQDIEDVLDRLEHLQQENQELKEQLKDEENWRVKIAKENSSNVSECLKLIEQKKQYKSVLDEIREYIEKDYSFAKRHDIPLLTKDEQLAGKLFEILDKVKE